MNWLDYFMFGLFTGILLMAVLRFVYVLGMEDEKKRLQ